MKKLGNYYEIDGNPIKCIHCESTNLDERITDTISFHPVEKECFCKECKKVLNSWSYGAWMPVFDDEQIYEKD